MPQGADAVIQVEDTSAAEPGPDGQKRVRINKAASKPGQDIRAVGSDIQAGTLVLEKGEMVGVAEVGAASAPGFRRSFFMIAM